MILGFARQVAIAESSARPIVVAEDLPGHVLGASRSYLEKGEVDSLASENPEHIRLRKRAGNVVSAAKVVFSEADLHSRIVLLDPSAHAANYHRGVSAIRVCNP